jgi:glycogen(starch) synthase
MRVLIVGMGGIVPAFRDWPEVLFANILTARGYEVSAYGYRDSRNRAQAAREEMIGGAHVRRFDLGLAGLSPAIWGAMLHDPLPDVIHIFHLRNELAWQVLTFYAARGVPVLLEPIGLLHDRFLTANRDDPFSYPITYERVIFTARDLVRQMARSFSPRRHLDNYVVHFPLRRATRVIAVSQYERELLTRMGVNPERVCMIPLAIDLGFINEVLGQRPPPRSEKRPCLMFIGQIKYRKGFDLFLDAARRLRPRFPNLRCVMLSYNTSRQQDLERLLDDYQLRDCVELISRAPEEEKVLRYAAADVLVYPSRYEGFGLPPLEAMACGIPVVATDIPVLDELIQNEVNGLLTPRNDVVALTAAIERVLTDGALRELLVANGRRRARQEYGEDTLAERIGDLYKQVTR